MKMLIVLSVVFFVTCSESDQKKSAASFIAEEIVQENSQFTMSDFTEEIVRKESQFTMTDLNDEIYEIHDWDKLIELWFEENQHAINREAPLNENGHLGRENYISDLMIASIYVMFFNYTFFDNYFSQDEKYNFIEMLKKKYGSAVGGTFKDEFENRFTNNTVNTIHSEYITNYWKMVFSLFRIFYYSNIFIEHLSAEDIDRIAIQALLDFFNKRASWSESELELEFYARIGFPELTINYSKDCIRTYSFKGSGRYNSIIHFKTATNSINAVHIDFIDNYEHFYNLGFKRQEQYFVIGRLKDNVYLLTNHNYREESYRLLIAVTLDDEKIEPYNAFNGDNVLFFPLESRISHFEPIFTNEPLTTVTFFYDRRFEAYDHDGETLNIPIYDNFELIFDGLEFIGDYNTLNELMSGE